MQPRPNTLIEAPVGVVGAGRLGTAIAAALRAAGLTVDGPAGRGDVPQGCRVLLLCVPGRRDRRRGGAVAGAAPFVGHVSGATPLTELEPARAAAFGLHPLQTFAPAPAVVDFAGAGCAVAGTTPEALAVARGLAHALGMEPFEIDDAGRAAYHAAASMASNFLLALEAAAERLAAGAGLEPGEARELLAPLVRRTVENWIALGPERALTGPGGARRRAHGRRPARGRGGGRARAPRPLRLAAGAHARARGASGAGMKTVRTVAELRSELRPARRAEQTIGLVPTMGSLHEGHLSLVRRARAECDVVVVSLFVNPAQFGPGEDLAAYPRDEARDAELAAAEGVDLLFAPATAEVYPEGFATTVSVAGVTEVLEGDPASRGPGHFAGVATVVAKLLNMVQPDGRLLRPEGRPAGARDQPARAGPRHPGPGERLPHRPRSGRARAQLPQRIPRPGGARAGGGPLARAARGRGEGRRGRPRPRRACWRRPAPS